jgi:phage terminase large subunit
MKNSIQLNDKYVPIFTDKSRYFVVTGGRGSGKSFGITVFLLNLTYEAGHKVLFTRFTLTSAAASIIPEFIEKIELMGVEADFRITKDEIINLTTGSSIMFKGIRTSSGNQTAALKSLSGVTTFVLDEAEELTDEDTFSKIDFSIRSNVKQNRVVLILNPTTKEHWIYQRFFMYPNVKAGTNGTKGDTTYVHTTFEDNRSNLSKSYLEQLYDLKRRDVVKFEHQILGGWLNKAEGTIITNWKVGHFVQTDLMCYGQDFGFSTDITSLVKVSVDKDTRSVYVKQIYGKTNLSTSDIAYRNKTECGTDLIICDSAEPRLISELKNLGLNIKPTIKKKGSILSGIALMQDYQIIVDRESDGIIREINNYVWHERNQRPVDKFNHYIDAIRYSLMYLLQGVNSGKYVIR